MFPYGNPWPLVPFGRSVVGGYTFSPLAPVLGPEQTKLLTSPSSIVHGGQYDTTVNNEIGVATECVIR